MGESTIPVDATEARKRRKAIITQHRHEDSTSPSTGTSTDQKLKEDSSTTDIVGEDASTILAKDENATNRQGDDDEQEHDADHPHKHDGSWDDEEDDTDPAEEGNEEPNGKKQKVATRLYKKRTQIRYDPDVPMSKEQLAMWRRECRRVRNRESAAASRARVRSRIEELEVEVEDWKAKYARAVQRLEDLQKTQLKDSNGSL